MYFRAFQDIKTLVSVLKEIVSYLRNADMEKEPMQVTCVWLFLYVCNSLAIPQIMQRSGMEVSVRSAARKYDDRGIYIIIEAFVPRFS